MEIQAKLSFKHGRIMRALNAKKISVVELSRICGWDYQNLRDFINFERLCLKEDTQKLVDALKEIDPTITDVEIFPPQYNQVKEALQPVVSNKDIPLDLILSYDMDTFIEYKDEGINEFDKIDIPKVMKELKSKLKDREYSIVCMRFGIGIAHPLSCREIGKKIGLSHVYINNIIRHCFDKIRRHCPLIYNTIGEFWDSKKKVEELNERKDCNKRAWNYNPICRSTKLICSKAQDATVVDLVLTKS